MIGARGVLPLILGTALAVSCSKGASESVDRSDAKMPDSTLPAHPAPAATPSELIVEGVGVAPGIWVDQALFAKLDIADPVVLNEDVDKNGIRIRWWQHLGKGFQWVSTNQGVGSPDGPYWVSQVSSNQQGACFGAEYCVGQALAEIANDSEFTKAQNGLELTVSIEAGRINSLLLSSNAPPR